MASIFQRSDGTWQGDIPYKDGIKTKRKTVYGKKKKDVEEKVRKFTTELFNYGSPIDESGITFSDWAYKHLMTTTLKNVAATTFETYMGLYDNHIKNSLLGGMIIKDIRPIHIQQYLNSKEYLSDWTIKKLRFLMGAMFKSAIANNLTRQNPVEHIKVPKSKQLKKDIEILTRDEQKRYISSLSDEKYGILFLTTLFTGMRVGEITALKWGNVNLDTAILKVRESLKRTRVYNENGEYEKKIVTKEPKTNTSIRTIPLPDFLVKELKKHKLKSKFSTDKDFVFATSTGTSLGHTNIRKYNTRICTKAQIRPYQTIENGTCVTKYKGINFHALRHTFATRMIEQGADLKTVSQWLGHSDIKITMNIYVHVMEETKRAAAAAQQKLFEELTFII